MNEFEGMYYQSLLYQSSRWLCVLTTNKAPFKGKRLNTGFISFISYHQNWMILNKNEEVEVVQ